MKSGMQGVDGRKFDFVIIGGGINGAATGRELALAGKSVLMAERFDFGSGATSRSSRLVHCGLRYLAPGGPMSVFVHHPGRFLQVVRTVRRSMAARSELVRLFPQRLRKFRMQFPIYTDGPYAPWQIDAAFALLKTVGDTSVPLDYRRYSAKEAMSQLPFTRLLRQEGLQSVAIFTEYQIDWPERLAIDLVLDMEHAGGVALNYTTVAKFDPDGKQWRVSLTQAGTGETVHVQAKTLLNFAGPWIDQVNAAAGREVRRVVDRTKGAHIIVRLPEEFRDNGIMTLTGDAHPFYCFPWRDSHFLGPTETLYEGDSDRVRATDADVDYLLAEANHQLPGHVFRRDDVMYTWAGLRPLTHDPSTLMGARNRTFHELGPIDGPRLIALTNGSLGAHRVTARDTLAQLGVPVSGSAPPASARRVFDVGNDSGLGDDVFRRIAGQEHVEHLTDLLWGRTGLVWEPGHGIQKAGRVAESVADVLGWDERRVSDEVADYERLVREVL